MSNWLFIEESEVRICMEGCTVVIVPTIAQRLPTGRFDVIEVAYEVHVQSSAVNIKLPLLTIASVFHHFKTELEQVVDENVDCAEFPSAVAVHEYFPQAHCRISPFKSLVGGYECKWEIESHLPAVAPVVDDKRESTDRRTRFSSTICGIIGDEEMAEIIRGLAKLAFQLNSLSGNA